MREVHLETITGTLSWSKILPLGGFKFISAKIWDGKKFVKILGAVRTAESHLHWQFIGIGQICEDLSWNHRTSTRHRSETNGIAERAARRVKEGTSTVLLQSGLDEKWWAGCMECCCYLRSVQDLLADGKTLYERRFGEPFKGPVIPFGAMVEYHPISARDQARLHQFGKNVLSAIFFGYAKISGGIWEGNILVADIGKLENMDASEIHPHRINAKEHWRHKGEKILNSR